MTDLAQEILDATRIVTDAENARPGEPVHVQVLTGFTPAVPSVSSLTQTLTGTIGGTVGGVINGTLNGTLNTLVDVVQIVVKYQIVELVGSPPAEVPVASADFRSTPPFAAAATDTDPLAIAVLLKPPVGETGRFTPPRNYIIRVSISVTVEGKTIPKSIDIPVALPAIEIPAIALIGRHALQETAPGVFTFPAYEGNDPNRLVVMVKAASPAKTVGDVIAAVNSVMALVLKVQGLVDFGANFSDALALIADAVDKVPTVFFSVGNVVNLGDFGDMDEEASSLVVVGLADQQVTFYANTEFDKGNEHKVFTAAAPVPGLPIGVLIQPTFVGIDFENDPGDELNDQTESVRFGGA